MENYKATAQEFKNDLEGYEYDKDKIIAFLSEFEFAYGADFGIVSTDILDEMVEHEAKNGGFVRVAHFLAGIEWLNDDYYRLDGYGNAQDIKIDDLELWLDEIINGDYE